MKYYLVAVHDRRVNAFMTPVAVVSLPQAQRSFLKETGVGGEFHALKADVSLWCLGSFDEESGVFDGEERHQLVIPSAD